MLFFTKRNNDKVILPRKRLLHYRLYKVFHTWGRAGNMLLNLLSASKGVVYLFPVVQNFRYNPRLIVEYTLYRVYKKKLNRFEIALNFAKQPLVSSF